MYWPGIACTWTCGQPERSAQESGDNQRWPPYCPPAQVYSGKGKNRILGPILIKVPTGTTYRRWNEHAIQMLNVAFCIVARIAQVAAGVWRCQLLSCSFFLFFLFTFCPLPVSFQSACPLFPLCHPLPFLLIAFSEIFFLVRATSPDLDLILLWVWVYFVIRSSPTSIVVDPQSFVPGFGCSKSSGFGLIPIFQHIF